MEASNKPALAPGPAGAAAVAALWHGSLGFTVRCTPRRRTVLGVDAGGRVLFGKLRSGRCADALAEWHWLHALPRLGIGVPVPVAFERKGRRSLVCTLAAGGRPLDALLRDAVRSGHAAGAVAYACAVVAPMVRKLHDAGLAVRDLYWNHLFAVSLAPASTPVLLDVERVFRPRWRRRRWIVKDLAGLRSSAPGALGLRPALRFLRSYLGRGSDRRDRHALARAVARKAFRIAAHRPRYG